MTLALTRACVLAVAACALAAQTPLTYPTTRKADVVDDYHGTKLADPYRWLEDDRSAETAAWVASQNQVTQAYLGAIPERKPIEARLTKLWNYEKFGTPSRHGKLYTYTHNSGLQNQGVLYVTQNLKDKGRILLDPNTLSREGTQALSGYSVSEDGKLLAYAISEGGSDWQVWHVRDIATGRDLPDEVRWIKNQGAVSWMKDGSGFYYSRYDAPKDGDALKGVNRFQKVYFHRIGSSQAQDSLIYERPDQPEWYLGASITEDGHWLLVYQRQGTDRRSRVYVKDLTRPDAPIQPLFDKFDAAYTIEGNDGDSFFVKTDQGAPRGRFVKVSLKAREAKDWKVVLPEGPGRDVLASVNLVGGRLAATWRIDALQKVRLYSLEGRFEKEISLPGVGSLSGFGGRRNHTESFYSFTSYNQPTTLYRYDFSTGKSEVFRQPKVDMEPAAFQVTEVFYASKDGTKIPMFLAHRKGLKLDGQNPTLLYGYGGFNIPATPGFTPATLAWLEMGGVYAQACLRGGSEYGREWYDAGKLRNKQNVFDDFIAAAEWLIKKKYTSTPKLAIHGGSNGGLLVGACMTQRPELFGAALPAVGVMDMLRYHKFTIGWGWKSDYDCSDEAEGFKYLMTYSPLHTLKAGVKYPPTLVTTGDHDDRVVPAHSHKFIATLQAAQAGSAPVLTRIETNAGHGAGKPTAKQIAERADQWAFLVQNLGMKLPAGFGL